jgi:hypothetical protein
METYYSPVPEQVQPPVTHKNFLDESLAVLRQSCPKVFKDLTFRELQAWIDDCAMVLNEMAKADPDGTYWPRELVILAEAHAGRSFEGVSNMSKLIAGRMLELSNEDRKAA